MQNSWNNDRLELRISSPAREVILADRQRQCVWQLDLTARGTLPIPTVEPLPDGFRLTYTKPEGAIRYLWTLASDHVRVELESAPATIDKISLPGPLLPNQGKASLLLSAYQGVLYRPAGYHWTDTRPPGGHGHFNLSMNALLAERGGLLVTQESVTDWECKFGEDEQGPSFEYRQLKCPIDGWYRREVRLYPVDATITAVTKRYRRRVQERGEFVSWAEKIAKRPAVEKLFGALLAFTGYNHAPEVDYVAGARKINEMGFDSVLYYPVRMASYSLDFLMGGDKPVWLSDETLRELKAIPGAMVGPWGWWIEGLDDGSDRMQKIYHRLADNQTLKGWSIEKQQWHYVCSGEQIGVARQRYATDMRAMDWIHYDVVSGSLGRLACLAKDHPSHPGRILTRRDQVQEQLKLLGPEVNENRIVSSEGFLDRFTPSYDIAGAKLWPACGRDVEFIPVPLTGLVFHDSTIHNWWELDNYNLVPGFPGYKGGRFGNVGSGGGEKMAAQDALYGCPPQVYPFGRQYAWVDIESRRTFSFCIQLADRGVQKALQIALPIAKLHRKIGQLEMMSFDLVTEDAAVQTTQFADGTRIVANVSDKYVDTEEGRLPANSWKEIPV